MPNYSQNNFDLIRLFAAFQVMITHAIAHLGPDIPENIDRLINAFPGVPIFFVVSGFVIAGSYARQPDMRSYARRRAARIYPALWVNLIGITILLAVVGNLAIFPWQFRFWLWHFLAFILGSDYLASNLAGWLFGTGGPLAFYPSGVLWTLPIELSFYALAPLILSKRLAARSLTATSLLLWGTVSIACFFTIDRVGDAVVFVGLYLWIFLLGAAAYTFWNRVRRLFEGKLLVWLASHLILTVSIYAFASTPPVYVTPNWQNVLHTCTLAGVVLSAGFTAKTTAEQLLRRFDISYGLYLWHMPVFCVFIISGWVGSWAWFFFACLASVNLAACSRQFVEAPAMRRLGNNSLSQNSDATNPKGKRP